MHEFRAIIEKQSYLGWHIHDEFGRMSAAQTQDKQTIYNIGQVVKVRRSDTTDIIIGPINFHEIKYIEHPNIKGLRGIPYPSEGHPDIFRVHDKIFIYKGKESALNSLVKFWEFNNESNEINYLQRVISGEYSIEGIKYSDVIIEQLSKIGINTEKMYDLKEKIEFFKSEEAKFLTREDSLNKTKRKILDRLALVLEKEKELPAINAHISKKTAELDTLKEELAQKNSELESLRRCLHEREQKEGNPRAKLRNLEPLTDEVEALDIASKQLKGRTDILQLLSLHLALKHAPFTVLTGPSGAGKTSLLRAYANILGIHTTLIAVQPNWTGVQNLHGYADPLNSQYYRGTPFSEVLQAQIEYDRAYELNAPLDLILLDEINLSFVEYFLADYLSAFETDERAVQLVTHDEAHQLQTEKYDWLKHNNGRIRVPKSILIAGTANEDHTTRSFSDKFRDRSAFLQISSPDIKQVLASPQTFLKQEKEAKHYIPRSAWEKWLDNSLEASQQQYQEIQKYAGKIKQLNLPISARVFRRALKIYADAEYILDKFDSKLKNKALDLALSITVAPKYAHLAIDKEGNLEEILDSSLTLTKKAFKEVCQQ